MLAKISIAVAVLLTVFIGYVMSREGRFRYERSGLINAPAEKIYPYISQLHLGGQWSPYEKKDPNMKKQITGADGAPGAVMAFDGNSQSGSGLIEILRVVPNSGVDMKLTMTKPFHAENLIEYRLTPEEAATRFTWAMSGDGGFMGKLMNVFIDCEKMVAGDFEIGIANLKTLVEAQP